MQETKSPRPHTVVLDNRENIVLTGIVDVPGFDEQTVNVETPLGTLIIKGEQLHISKLSLETGDVTVDGHISSLQYLSGKSSKGIASRLFR